MNEKIFRVSLRIPQRLGPSSAGVETREDFCSWLWARFGSSGLVGIHEGSVFPDDTNPKGGSVDGFLNQETAGSGFSGREFFDSGPAPASRDWVAGLAVSEAVLFFSEENGAMQAIGEIRSEFSSVEVLSEAPEPQVDQDWNAKWRASFTRVKVAPFWEIIPAWDQAPPSVGRHALRLNPGAGFGTGTHETTQLCLAAIAAIAALDMDITCAEVLDFGSGSGILSIACALFGAKVSGIEIDPLARENGKENCRLNVLRGSVRFSQSLSPEGRDFDLVIANILKPVLLEFAEPLVMRMKKKGALILSGLIEKDLDEVSTRYCQLLQHEPRFQGPAETPQILKKGDWYALVWK